jgi:hypothetical protein
MSVGEVNNANQINFTTPIARGFDGEIQKDDTLSFIDNVNRTPLDGTSEGPGTPPNPQGVGGPVPLPGPPRQKYGLVDRQGPGTPPGSGRDGKPGQGPMQLPLAPSTKEQPVNVEGKKFGRVTPPGSGRDGKPGPVPQIQTKTIKFIPPSQVAHPVGIATPANRNNENPTGTAPLGDTPPPLLK